MGPSASGASTDADPRASAEAPGPLGPASSGSTSGPPHPRSRVPSILAWVATALFGVWLGWNLGWLSRAEVPPSLLTGLTGIPSPTTGGTRAILALLDGDVATSLRYNAMAVPCCVLFAWSLARLGWLALRRQRPRLDPITVRAWILVLVMGQAQKLLSDPAWW